MTRTYARALRPGLAEIMPTAPGPPSKLRSHFDRLHAAIDQRVQEVRLAA